MTRRYVQLAFMLMNIYRRFRDAICSRQPRRAPLGGGARISSGLDL